MFFGCLELRKTMNQQILRKENQVMKSGRPLEYDLEEVLEIAMHLFWRKGYNDTSISDLLKAMKISKSTFYYAFNSKYQLFEQCIYRLRDRQIAKTMIDLQQAENGRSFIEKLLYDIEKITYAKESSHNDFLMDTVFETSEHHPRIATLISNTSLRFVEILKLAIERGQSERVISEHKDPNELAYYFISSIAGLRTMAKANTEQRNIRNIISITLTALD